jgi:protein-L-isoaspartate(D-aspartate) O-methyltransferase
MGAHDMQFENARIHFVDGQLRTNDVTTPDVLAAFLSVPRELFVPASRRPIAYTDMHIEVKSADENGPARYILSAMPFARMIQAADITKSDVVLDVGCATGYSSAILSYLADSVIAIEQDEGLVERANNALTDAGVDTVAVVHNALKNGLPSEGPYDVIFLEGAVEAVPDDFFESLKNGGRLVCIVGKGASAEAICYLKDDGVISKRTLFNCSAPELPGFSLPKGFVF